MGQGIGPALAAAAKFIGANAGAITTGAAAVGSAAAALRRPGMPSMPKPTTMPTPDDAAVEAARRRRLLAETMRSGRMSTILGGSGERDTLGG